MRAADTKGRADEEEDEEEEGAGGGTGTREENVRENAVAGEPCADRLAEEGACDWEGEGEGEEEESEFPIS